MAALRAAVAALLLSACGVTDAWPQFIALVPNAIALPWTIALGHISPIGGGPCNSFGVDFALNQNTWDRALACLDSDGDGFPNGWELGDPCGDWTLGNPPLWSNDVAHPGNGSSVPETRSVDWSICGGNVCEEPGVRRAMRLLEQRAAAALEGPQGGRGGSGHGGGGHNRPNILSRCRDVLYARSSSSGSGGGISGSSLLDLLDAQTRSPSEALAAMAALANASSEVAEPTLPASSSSSGSRLRGSA